MPVPTSITIVSGHLKVGLTAAALDAFDCQVVTATLTANPKLNTVKATFCSPESEAPAATGYQLDLNFLQDWSDPDGVCWFAFENDAALVYWELALTDDVAPDDANVTMHGQAYVVALGFGGDAGTPLESAATWPVLGKPIKGPSTGALAADAGADDALADA